MTNDTEILNPLGQELIANAPAQEPINMDHVPDWVCEMNYAQILMTGLSGRRFVYQKANRSHAEAKAIAKRRAKKKNK